MGMNEQPCLWCNSRPAYCVCERARADPEITRLDALVDWTYLAGIHDPLPDEGDRIEAEGTVLDGYYGEDRSAGRGARVAEADTGSGVDDSSQQKAFWPEYNLASPRDSMGRGLASERARRERKERYRRK